MSNLNANTVILGGNCIKDPRPMGSGTIFRMSSVSRRHKDNPLFIDVKVFGNLSGICKEHIKRGTKVNVVGRLDLREGEYTDSSGQSVWKSDYAIVADTVDYDNF